MRLNVELYGHTVGTLQGTNDRDADFVVTPEALTHFGVGSRILSATMPLAGTLPRKLAARRRNFFQELLPEGAQLDYMYAQSGLRKPDLLGFLARYGRDVAGALQMWDADDPSEPRAPSTRRVNSAQVRKLLESPQAEPLANVSGSGKTSLAGVQPKIVLARGARSWLQVLSGAPSTHIVKPYLAERPSMIFDEEYGARISRRLGLAAFDTWIEDFEGLPALVIERFDRSSEVEDSRIHQEDFSQVLGLSGNEKYQEVGGGASLRRIAHELGTLGNRTQLERLGRMTVLAVAIGNLDMHTKNIGLLHWPDGHVDMAPAYDMVPLTHQPGIDGRMALAINKKYVHAQITREDLVQETQSWGVKRAGALVDETLVEIAATVAVEEPKAGAAPELVPDIKRYVANLMRGKAAGTSG